MEYLTSGVILVVVVLLLQGLELYSGSFSFLFYFFEAVCIRQALGLCVVAEAECNCYLRDINIYSLSKKKSNGVDRIVCSIPTYTLAS